MIHSVNNILRLCRRCIFLQNRCVNHTSAAEKLESERKQNKNKQFASLLQEYKDKITFNSYLEHEKLELGYFKYYLKTLKSAQRQHIKEFREKSLQPIPVSLQYYVDKDKLLRHDLIENQPNNENVFQLPFGKPTNVGLGKNEEKIQKINEANAEINKEAEFNRSGIEKWMTNYEYFDDTKYKDFEDNDEVNNDWHSYYGTPDPLAAVSTVPCGGCGALLHCSDPAIPGYLPSEIFKGRDNDELKTIECQRCHFLKEYNIALDVSVDPEEYEKLLQSIKHVKSLVLLMVDLLDFPCSLWPGIVDIIGTKRPIIVVGNKVDLLPGDSVGYLKRIRESLITELKKTKLSEANIQHVALISAKTGYGVEDLISTLFKNWLYKGDVFLVGTTNVGKSSLFNALLQSDYCKVHAVDIIKRATVSRWPGTTLNLLKFPINRPSGWKIYQRTRRLQSESKIMKIEKDIRKGQLHGQVPREAPALIGHIGRTFSELHEDPNDTIAEKRNLMVLDEKHELFARSRWFYDTPGVIHPDQVLSLLSTEELLLTIPKRLIRPQTYYIHKGNTIFIGGLARIDHVTSCEPCRYTIFSSETLPITVVNTEYANEIYDKFLGTELFAVPSGGEERLNTWPGLTKRVELFEFTGEGFRVCCGDIVLSSIGWVSLTARKGARCKVRAWTPEGRGIHKRYPSLLPYAVNLKGKRVRDTPAYMVGKTFSENK